MLAVRHRTRILKYMGDSSSDRYRMRSEFVHGITSRIIRYEAARSDSEKIILKSSNRQIEKIVVKIWITSYLKGLRLIASFEKSMRPQKFEKIGKKKVFRPIGRSWRLNAKSQQF